MNLSKKEIRTILADIYKESCLIENCDMREIAFVFEDITRVLLEFNTIEAWQKVNIDKQRFDKSPYIELIVQFKERVLDSLTNKIIAHVNKLIADKKDNAFKTWYNEYTDALVNWQGDVYYKLCKTSFDFTEKEKKQIQHFDLLNYLILDGNWVETFDYYNELANDKSLTTVNRCRFKVIAAQVMLYHLGDLDKALEMLRKAESLDQNNSYVESAFGEYELHIKNIEKARTHFLNAMSLDAQNINNYCYMGDTYKEEKKWDAAEQWYNDALQVNFLDTTPYSRLILLCGTEELIDKKEGFIDEILDKIKLIDKNNEGENIIYSRYRNAGFAYYQTLRYKQAIKYYKKAIELKPNYSSAMVDIAYMYAYDENYSKAEEWFLKSIAVDKTNHNFDSYWGLGWLYGQKGDPQKSIEAFKKCIGLRKYGNDRLFNNLGNTHFNNGLYTESIEYYEKAIEENPNESVYYDNLKNTYEKVGDNIKLEAILLHMLELFPNRDDYFNNVGTFYYNQANYQKAIEYYSKALSLEKSKANYWSNRAYSYEHLQQYDKAELDYLKAIDIDRTANRYNYFGVMKYKRNDFKTAKEYFQKAIDLDKNDPIYFENLGLAHDNLDKVDQINKSPAEFSKHAKEAEKSFKKAIEVSNEAAEFLNRLGLFYSKRKLYNKALEMYSKAFSKEKESLIFQGNVALAYENLGEFEKAVELYQQILDKQEDNRGAQAGLLNSKLALKKDNEVLEIIESFLKKYSDYYELHQYRGSAFEAKYMYRDALESYKRALVLNPESEYLNNRAGIMHYYLGTTEDLKSAISYYQKAVDINPHNDIYIDNLILVYEKLDDENALKELKKKKEDLLKKQN